MSHYQLRAAESKLIEKTLAGVVMRVADKVVTPNNNQTLRFDILINQIGFCFFPPIALRWLCSSPDARRSSITLPSHCQGNDQTNPTIPMRPEPRSDRLAKKSDKRLDQTVSQEKGGVANPEQSGRSCT